MTVVLLEANLVALLESPAGPVGLDLARRAEKVAEKARENASGAVIGVQSGDLLHGIKAEVGVGIGGLHATVGTDAEHRGFGYPAFHDQTGRPWLSGALEDAFN